MEFGQTFLLGGKRDTFNVSLTSSSPTFLSSSRYFGSIAGTNVASEIKGLPRLRAFVSAFFDWPGPEALDFSAHV